MKFSVCIPNFNYANYLGATFESLKALRYPDLEVVVSDNASTDDSVQCIKEAEPFFSSFKYRINKVNVGFAANLDRAAELATGDYLIMLSSDDLVKPVALEVYNSIANMNTGVVISSAWDIIDHNGKVTGRTGPNPKLWHVHDKDHFLSAQLQCPVYRVKSSTLLTRCLLHMATPFNFCTVAYPRSAYERTSGYGATRLINPDKWFHWRLLMETTEAIYIDDSLFQYRWHNQNQTAQQSNSGYLKFMIDEYRNTIELTDEILQYACLSRVQIERSFIQRDIYRHGMGEFSKGRWLKSLRIFFFGLSTYPGIMLRNIQFVAYVLLLFTTPVGSWVISRLRGLL